MSKTINFVPGPGQYEQRSLVIEGPQYSIGSKIAQRKERTPGPGDYEYLKTQGLAVTFKGRHKSPAPENIPGPGAYEKKSTLQEGPAFSIGEKRKTKV